MERFYNLKINTDEVFDSGLFHEYVIGAIRVALFNLGYSLSAVDEVAYNYIDVVLHIYDAERLRRWVPANISKHLEKRMPDILADVLALRRQESEDEERETRQEAVGRSLT